MHIFADPTNSQFFSLDDSYDLEVRRDADEHPIVDIKISELQPCISLDELYQNEERLSFVLEFHKSTFGCPNKEYQDTRYRQLPDLTISEQQLYTENKVVNILENYVPIDQYYTPGFDHQLYFFSSTNFIWN